MNFHHHLVEMKFGKVKKKTDKINPTFCLFFFKENVGLFYSNFFITVQDKQLAILQLNLNNTTKFIHIMEVIKKSKLMLLTYF